MKNTNNVETKTGINRRDLLCGAVASTAVAVISAQALASPAPAAGALKLVAETDPTAKALGYVHDPVASKSQRPDKQGVKGADQVCINCQLYTKQGEIDKAEVGKCTMIMGGSVKGKGWCKSWMKKV